MSTRALYLAAYDVAEPGRLAAALDLVRGYSTGGQKSVHEIYLTSAEHADLLQQMAWILDEAADRFMLLRLDPRARTRTIGRGVQPADPSFFLVV